MLLFDHEQSKRGLYAYTWLSMEIPTASVNESLEAIKKLEVDELSNILRYQGQPMTGNKADLVLQCHVLFERQKTPTNALPVQENVPLFR